MLGLPLSTDVLECNAEERLAVEGRGRQPDRHAPHHTNTQRQQRGGLAGSAQVGSAAC